MTSRTTKKKHGNQDESNAEPANPHANMASEDKEVSTNRLTEKNQESNIMSAITSMREDFSVQFTGILSAIQEVKQEVKEFSDRLSNAEHRISDTEDQVSVLQNTVDTLQQQVKLLGVKLEDQENRSCRNNVRLVGLPEGAEGSDTVGFLERWLPEVLGPENFANPIIIERAHRLQDRRDRNAPRILIMRFLNSKDKDKVLQVVRAKGKVKYDEREVKFFQDIARETHLNRRKFYEVKQQLKSMGIRYGIIFPAKLRVTHEGRDRIFENPPEVENFIRNLKDSSS